MAEIREVKPKFIAGSKEEKFEKIKEEFCGKAKYFQEFDTEKETAGKVTVDRDRKINEFGGETHAYMYNDIVTITKCNAFGVVKERIKKHIDEFEI